ncbi:MAG: putative rane protein, partial [Pedosphaera sp.]|nr:putative rane protein [Pedosphaera sp.]
MRQRPLFQVQWSVTLVLILINVVVFVIQNVADHTSHSYIYDRFALSVDGLKQGHFWQLVTFQFLHLPLLDGGVFHLLGNLFVIYIFGSPVEGAIGKMNFTKLYLLSGILGGMLQMAGGFFWPEHFGQAVVGASAGAFGLIAAFATLFPHRVLYLFFLPIEPRVKTLLWLGILISVIGMVLPPK